MMFLVDEATDEDQRTAPEDVYLGRAGDIFGAATDTHVENTEVATASSTFTRDGTELSIDVGDGNLFATAAPAS